MNTPQDLYDVAIVGLGPTGLTLAHLLGRRGLRVLALEREPQFYGNARAVYTDDECMRVFRPRASQPTSKPTCCSTRRCNGCSKTDRF